MRLLILLGTKKGAFILESDATPVLGAARPVLRGVADEPCRCRSGDRHDLRRRRQRMVRPGGVEVHRPRRHLDAFERGPRLPGGRRRRSNRSGAWRRRTARLYAGVEPAGLFRSDDGGQIVAACRGLRDHPIAAELAAGRRRADPAFARAASRPTTQQLWVGISAAGVFHTARWRRDLGRRATTARAATSCRKSNAIRNSASACIAWSWRRACPTGCTSRTTAACIAATMAASIGTASRRACRRPSAFPRRRIRAIPRRSSCCRSTATSRAATCPRARPRSGARATAARLAGAARRPAAGERVLRRAAPGDGDRSAGAGRGLFRHQHRRAVRQRRRGRQLALHRAAPAADPLGGDAGRSRRRWSWCRCRRCW